MTGRIAIPGREPARMDRPVQDRSPLEIGALITLATLGIAGLIGLIAVIDADNDGSAFGLGIGIAFLVFLTGATIACAIACLKRGRMEIVALGSIVVAGLATDMFVLAAWQEIDNETYGKVAGIAFVWSFFALVALGLTLAVGTPAALARSLYLGSVVATVVAGLISTWLIATAGGGTAIVAEGASFSFLDVVIGDEKLLRALGAAFVLLSVLWFGALAASRIEQRPPESHVEAHV